MSGEIDRRSHFCNFIITDRRIYREYASGRWLPPPLKKAILRFFEYIIFPFSPTLHLSSYGGQPILRWLYPCRRASQYEYTQLAIASFSLSAIATHGRGECPLPHSLIYACHEARLFMPYRHTAEHNWLIAHYRILTASKVI